MGEHNDHSWADMPIGLLAGSRPDKLDEMKEVACEIVEHLTKKHSFTHNEVVGTLDLSKAMLDYYCELHIGGQ